MLLLPSSSTLRSQSKEFAPSNSNNRLRSSQAQTNYSQTRVEYEETSLNHLPDITSHMNLNLKKRVQMRVQSSLRQQSKQQMNDSGSCYPHASGTSFAFERCRPTLLQELRYVNSNQNYLCSSSSSSSSSSKQQTSRVSNRSSNNRMREYLDDSIDRYAKANQKWKPSADAHTRKPFFPSEKENLEQDQSFGELMRARKKVLADSNDLFAEHSRQSFQEEEYNKLAKQRVQRFNTPIGVADNLFDEQTKSTRMSLNEQSFDCMTTTNSTTKSNTPTPISMSSKRYVFPKKRIHSNYLMPSTESSSSTILVNALKERNSGIEADAEKTVVPLRSRDLSILSILVASKNDGMRNAVIKKSEFKKQLKNSTGVQSISDIALLAKYLVAYSKHWIKKLQFRMINPTFEDARQKQARTQKILASTGADASSSPDVPALPFSSKTYEDYIQRKIVKSRQLIRLLKHLADMQKLTMKDIRRINQIRSSCNKLESNLLKAQQAQNLSARVEKELNLKEGTLTITTQQQPQLQLTDITSSEIATKFSSIFTSDYFQMHEKKGKPSHVNFNEIYQLAKLAEGIPISEAIEKLSTLFQKESIQLQLCACRESQIKLTDEINPKSIELLYDFLKAITMSKEIKSDIQKNMFACYQSVDLNHSMITAFSEELKQSGYIDESTVQSKLLKWAEGGYINLNTTTQIFDSLISFLNSISNTKSTADQVEIASINHSEDQSEINHSPLSDESFLSQGKQQQQQLYELNLDETIQQLELLRNNSEELARVTELKELIFVDLPQFQDAIQELLLKSFEFSETYSSLSQYLRGSLNLLEQRHSDSPSSSMLPDNTLKQQMEVVNELIDVSAWLNRKANELDALKIFDAPSSVCSEYSMNEQGRRLFMTELSSSISLLLELKEHADDISRISNSNAISTVCSKIRLATLKYSLMSSVAQPSAQVANFDVFKLPTSSRSSTNNNNNIKSTSSNNSYGFFEAVTVVEEVRKQWEEITRIDLESGDCDSDYFTQFTQRFLFGIALFDFHLNSKVSLLNQFGAYLSETTSSTTTTVSEKQLDFSPTIALAKQQNQRVFEALKQQGIEDDDWVFPEKFFAELEERETFSKQVFRDSAKLLPNAELLQHMIDQYFQKIITKNSENQEKVQENYEKLARFFMNGIELLKREQAILIEMIPSSTATTKQQSLSTCPFYSNLIASAMKLHSICLEVSTSDRIRLDLYEKMIESVGIYLAAKRENVSIFQNHKDKISFILRSQEEGSAIFNQRFLSGGSVLDSKETLAMSITGARGGPVFHKYKACKNIEAFLELEVEAPSWNFEFTISLAAPPFTTLLRLPLQQKRQTIPVNIPDIYANLTLTLISIEKSKTPLTTSPLEVGFERHMSKHSLILRAKQTTKLNIKDLHYNLKADEAFKIFYSQKQSNKPSAPLSVYAIVNEAKVLTCSPSSEIPRQECYQITSNYSSPYIQEWTIPNLKLQQHNLQQPFTKADNQVIRSIDFFVKLISPAEGEFYIYDKQNSYLVPSSLLFKRYSINSKDQNSCSGTTLPNFAEELNKNFWHAFSILDNTDIVDKSMIGTHRLLEQFATPAATSIQAENKNKIASISAIR